MSKLSQDFRFALRTFGKSPVFTTVAVASLALGIGANTAIFTLMDQVLLRMLPVREPERLVQLDQQGPNQGSTYGPRAFSYPMYMDFRDRAEVFSGVIARFTTHVSLTHKAQTERVRAELVSGNYFDVLGVGAAKGRLISPADDRNLGGHPVAVLSHSLWQTKFGGSTEILNQKILLNGHPMVVIGIAAPGFGGVQVGAISDVYVPMMMKPQITPTWNGMDDRRVMWLNIFARLNPGVSEEQAKASVQVLYKQVLESLELPTIREPSARFRSLFLDKKIAVLPASRGTSDLRRDAEKPLWVLTAMVGLVLLIACANVANLLTARAASRQKEIAIRLSLGASRGQIVRQLLVESVALAAAGGVFGLLVAAWTGDLLLSLLPLEAGRSALSTSPDARVLAYNFAISIAAALLFGLVPAIQATRPELATVLKDEAGNLSTASGQVRFRKGLVVAQIALSLLLLIGAGLFTRSLYNLRELNPGFVTENLMTFKVDPSLVGYQKERALALYERVQQSIAAIPGVRSASMATVAVLTGDRNISTVRLEGYEAKEGEDMNPDINEIGPGYFTTMRIPILLGREFTPADRLGAPKVAVVNETMAKKYFGGNPLGRKLAFGGRSKVIDIEIVGVVKDQKSNNLREEIPRFVYVPVLQRENPSQIAFYARTDIDPAQMANALRREVQRVDANMPVTELKSMEVQVSESLFVERLVAMLSAFFGLLATVLAAIGLYGVMAYTVARRTREIGVRMALGAERSVVLWMVMKEVALLALIGVLIGLPAAVGLGRYVQSQLFGLEPTDPFTLGLATLSLVIVAFFAGYIPADRATRIDPMIALRYE
jgi:predicted permease